MKIGVAYDKGQIANQLGECRTFLIVTVEGKTPIDKRLLTITETSTAGMIKTVGMEQLDVIICGSLGLGVRNALEMLGALLVPGCTGSAEEAVAKFLVGERQGDPSLLEIGREEDPDDPMACMRDCAKCAGCAPLEILQQIPEQNDAPKQ